MEQRVEVSIEAGVAHVELARPEKRNGLDLPMFEALIAAGERLAKDRRVRAVVLSGRGKAFCAGLDWAAFLSMGMDGSNLLLQRSSADLSGVGTSPANLAQRLCWIWQELSVPVIAAVVGQAFGGGLQLALAADIRVLARDAQVSVMEIKYGLIPDMSATKTLLRLVRPDIARELTWTGRIVGAEEARALGLATHVVDDPLQTAMHLAQSIATRSPEAIRAAKKLFSAAVELPVSAAFALETELQLSLLGSPNQLEAVQATMMKREPSFSD